MRAKIMALTPEEQAMLATLLARKAEDDTPPAETAADVVAEVGPELVETVGDVAETVAITVAHTVAEATQGEAERLTRENAELRAALDDEREARAQAEALAQAAVTAAVLSESEPEPEPAVDEPEPVVDELTEDTPPEVKPHPYFRTVRMPWQKR